MWKYREYTAAASALWPQLTQVTPGIGRVPARLALVPKKIIAEGRREELRPSYGRRGQLVGWNRPPHPASDSRVAALLGHDRGMMLGSTYAVYVDPARPTRRRYERMAGGGP
ncbi:hypothetical protein GCM10027048_07180 [Hymenobacter coalescens]